MKRKSLLIAAMSVVLTCGTGVIGAWAGWDKLDGNWVYYTSSGSVVTNEWKKGGDNLWRYLDSSGTMAVNTWVNGEYYVDDNGIMIADKWYKITKNNYGDSRKEYWYYFNSSGKAVMDTWKKINDKWYYFGGDGVMQTGWVDDDMAFCGEDGAAKIGWQKLEPPEGSGETGRFNFDDDGKNWYYFSSTGKKYVPDLSDGGEYGQRRIDNAYYCFNYQGVMQTGWVYLGSDSAENADMADYRFYGSDGKVKTGWYSTEPPQGRRGYEEEVEWFYFSKAGVPRANKPKNQGRLYTSDIISINKKRYLFNDNGNPVYGLQKVYTSDVGDTYTAYYFGANRNVSTAASGRFKVDEGDGSSSEFYFTESGKGYTGVHGSSVYYMGKLQKAEAGVRYQIISLPNGSSYTNYLINTGGKVVKSTSGVKDADGVKYTTNSSGILQKINDNPVGNERFRAPTEPIWY